MFLICALDLHISAGKWREHSQLTSEDLKLKGIQDFLKLFEKEIQNYFKEGCHFNPLLATICTVNNPVTRGLFCILAFPMLTMM